MKPSLACSLAVAAMAFLSLTTYAVPPAHVPARRHMPTVAKRPRRSAPVKPFGPTGRAYILHGTVPGGDPNRIDHMALGKGMHPEQIDHMNAMPLVVPAVPAPNR